VSAVSITMVWMGTREAGRNALGTYD